MFAVCLLVPVPFADFEVVQRGQICFQVFRQPGLVVALCLFCVGTQWILDLCNGILKEGCIPKDWKSSVILPICKEKGIQWSVDLSEELNCWNML